MTSPDLSHEELLSLVDDLLADAPTEARDIRDELFEICHQHRDARSTERPGERFDR